MVNKVHLIGNLGKDPETRFTPEGKAQCKFQIATSERWTDKDGKKQERTQWHNVVVWGKQAEACGQYLTKGKRVYVEGKITYRSWEGKEDGKTHYITEIQSRDVRFLSPSEKKDGEQDRATPPDDYDIPS